MKSIFVKSALLVLLSFGLVQVSEAHGVRGRGCNQGPCRQQCYRQPVRAIAPARYYAPAPRYYRAPVKAYVRPVWVPSHWATGRYGQQVWIKGHYR